MGSGFGWVEGWELRIDAALWWLAEAEFRMVRVAGICIVVKVAGACPRVTTEVVGLIWACGVIIWGVPIADLNIPGVPGAIMK